MLNLPRPVERLLGRRRATAAVPAGLDVEQFLHLARLSFMRLQAAWDDADLPTLERLTMGPVLQDLRDQLESRGEAMNRTDVLRLHAQLLAFEELRDAFVASVEFSGLIRERQDAGATEFRELWMLAKLKPVDGDAWQLARVQALA
jgi:predicted lipid-binding transport protein (Tim44 family)